MKKIYKIILSIILIIILYLLFYKITNIWLRFIFTDVLDLCLNDDIWISCFKPYIYSTILSYILWFILSIIFSIFLIKKIK